MKKILINLAAALVLTAFAAITNAQVVEKKTLTLDGAKKVIAAAQVEAKRVNAPGGVIAGVAGGGSGRAAIRLPQTRVLTRRTSAGRKMRNMASSF